MNLAAKHNVEVALRATDTIVLTITAIEERNVRFSDGTIHPVDVLLGKAANGTTYSVRLNDVTATQLVRLCGPETDAMLGKRVLAAPYVKGDRSFVSFAPAPPPTPAAAHDRLAGPSPDSTCPTKGQGQGPQLSAATRQVLAESARINSTL